MYKTIIFIVNSFDGYINKYDPNLLAQLADKRLVIVVNKKLASSISDDHKKYFSRIVEVSESEDGFYHKGLNEIQIEAILTEELSSLSHSKELLLITHNESCVELAAKMREKFNLSGVLPVFAMILTNKIMMKSKLIGSGFRIPAYIDFKNAPQENVIQCYRYIKEKLSHEFVVKPICGAGSFGVKKITNLDEFSVFFNDRKNELLGFYIEEYVAGDLYHCDSIVKNNKVIKTLISKYNYPMLEFMYGKNVGSYPFNENPSLIARLDEFNANILVKLGAVDGVYHSEIFMEDGTREFVFLESAVRSPGGYIIQAYDKAYNINLLDCDLKLKLDVRVDLSDSRSPVYCFWAYIPPVAGIVKHIIQPKLKSEYSVKWLAQQGDNLQPPKSLKDRVGEIFLWNSDYQELMNDMDYISNNTFIKVE